MRSELDSLLQTIGGSNAWRADEVAAECHAPETVHTGFKHLDQELPGGGWPRGQLVELLVDRSGIGELSLLLPILIASSVTARPAVWVLPPQQATLATVPYAPALAGNGVDLPRLLFIQPSKGLDGLWAYEQSLCAQHLGAVIGWVADELSASSGFQALRRLHLLAHRHRPLAFVLRASRHAGTPSPAALRLHLESDGVDLRIHVLKRRGKPASQPITVALRPPHWLHSIVSLNNERTAAVDLPIPRPIERFEKAIDARR